jgi:hypothetical protein
LKENDLKDRLFEFAIDILKLLRNFSKGKEFDVIKYQLSKSATSSGATTKKLRLLCPGLIFPIKSVFH